MVRTLVSSLKIVHLKYSFSWDGSVWEQGGWWLEPVHLLEITNLLLSSGASYWVSQKPSFHSQIQHTPTWEQAVWKRSRTELAREDWFRAQRPGRGASRGGIFPSGSRNISAMKNLWYCGKCNEHRKLTAAPTKSWLKRKEGPQRQPQRELGWPGPGEIELEMVPAWLS